MTVTVLYSDRVHVELTEEAPNQFRGLLTLDEKVHAIGPAQIHGLRKVPSRTTTSLYVSKLPSSDLLLNFVSRVEGESEQKLFGPFSPNFFRGLKKGAAIAKSLRKQDVVFVLGPPKVGKTTVVNACIGARLEKRGVLAPTYEVVAPNRNGIQGGTIEHQTDSGWKFPQLFKSDSENPVNYFDVGGLFDLLGGEEISERENEIAIAEMTVGALDAARSIKILLCVDYASVFPNSMGNNSKFYAFLTQTLGKLVKDLERVSEDLFLVITKPPEGNPEYNPSPESVKEELDAIRTRSPASPLAPALEFIARENARYMVIGNLETIPETRRVIEEKLGRAPGIQDRKHLFGDQLLSGSSSQIFKEGMADCVLEAKTTLQSFFETRKRLTEEQKVLAGLKDCLAVTERLFKSTKESASASATLTKELDAKVKSDGEAMRFLADQLMRGQQEAEKHQGKINLLAGSRAKEKVIYWEDTVEMESLSRRLFFLRDRTYRYKGPKITDIQYGEGGKEVWKVKELDPFDQTHYEIHFRYTKEIPRTSIRLEGEFASSAEYHLLLELAQQDLRHAHSLLWSIKRDIKTLETSIQVKLGIRESQTKNGAITDQLQGDLRERIEKLQTDLKTRTEAKERLVATLGETTQRLLENRGQIEFLVEFIEGKRSFSRLTESESKLLDIQRLFDEFIQHFSHYPPEGE